MLGNQKKFSDYLKSLSELLSGTEFSANPERLEQVLHAELLVPVIGAFSAGKSTVLNGLIGTEVLPVGIAPETELATELRYSPESYLLAIKKNGDEERYSIEALKEINKKSGDYSYLRLFIDSPALKEIAPLVLVDMPGYGSSLESHNKALAYYLPKGVHFIVVTSIEDGNITRAMIRQLEDVKVYGGDFTFLLSKSNLRASGQVDEVRRYVNEQLETYFDAKYQAISVGNQDAKPVIDAIKSIDPESLFSGIFLPALKNENTDLLDRLTLAMNVIRRDGRESEKALRDLEKAMNRLLDQKADAEQEARKRYSGRLLDRSLKAVEQSLNDSVDELTTLAANRNNPNGVGNAIAEIIRSSLARTFKQEGDDITATMIDELARQISAASPDMKLPGSTQDGSQDIARKVGITLSAGIEKANSWSARAAGEFGKLDEDAQKKKQIYKAVFTTVAITTNFVGPLVELAIVFLPEIISFLTKGNEREKLRESLITEVLPNVKSELRGALPSILDEQLDALLANVNAAFENQINQQRAVIEAHQKQSSEKEEQANERLLELESLSESVSGLANQYLSS